MKFNKEELQKRFKDFDYQKEWEKIQEESPKIGKGIKILFYMLVGLLVLRGCNSCNGSGNQSTPKVENSIVNTDTLQSTETKEYKEPIKEEETTQPTEVEPTKREYQFSFTQDSRVTKEQLDYLMSQDVLSKYSTDEIRIAYFRAQDKWFQDNLLKSEDGEFVNFNKYLK